MRSIIITMAIVVAPASGFHSPLRRAAPGMRSASCRMQQYTPRPGSLAEVTAQQGQRPYGEESRRYRRTVYRHEDWLKHRSETRLLRNLKGTLTSGVVRSLISEVVAVIGVALFILVWNALLFGYLDLDGVVHPSVFGAGVVPDFLLAALPISIFTLSSPALGLLLVFRTNASYARWLEARIAWGRIVSHCRNIMRQSTLWIDMSDPKTPQALDELRLCVWAFPRSLWAHLSDPAKEARFRSELEEAMGVDAAAELLDASHRPLRALSLLSGAMERLPVDEKRRVEMDKSVILLGDACETCERLFASPVPLVYTRHTARFLSAWLLLLPFGLWDGFASTWNHFALLPAATLIAIFLFGIEELAVQVLSPSEVRERYFLAGGLCASISHALATPIDVVKTRQQTVDGYGTLSLTEGLARVVADDGPAALLTGVVPTVVGYGLEGALKFGAYEALKPYAASALATGLGLGPEQSATYGPIAAALVAGGLASLVLAPAEATRIRMVSDPEYAGLGLPGAASKVVRDEGAAGLLRGVPATCSKQLPYTATKQVTFDALVDAAVRLSPAVPRWASTGAAAASAAVLSTLASQPGDALLSEVGIIVTVQLILYDTLKHAFGVP